MKVMIIVLMLIMLPIAIAQITVPVDLRETEPQVVENVRSKYQLSFEYAGQDYQLVMEEVTNEFVKARLMPNDKVMNFVINDAKRVDLDRDTRKDITIGLDDLKETGATLIVVRLPDEQTIPSPIPEGSGLSPEDESEATNKLQSLLTVLPHVQTGVSVISGQGTVWSVAKSYGISFGLQALQEDKPEAGLMYQSWTGLQGLGNAMGIGTTQQPRSATPTGNFALSYKNFVVAMWDGTDFYYNFKVDDFRSKDLSFLFNKGEVYANRVYVFKDFEDNFLRFMMNDRSNVETSGDLFLHLEGNLNVDEEDAKIVGIDVESTTNNNRVAITNINNHPMSATLNSGSKLEYNEDLSELKVSNAEVDFLNNGYDIRVNDLQVSTSDASANMETSVRTIPRNTYLITQNKDWVEVMLKRDLNPVMNIIKINPSSTWFFTLMKDAQLNVYPASNARLRIDGSDISTSFRTNDDSQIRLKTRQSFMLEKIDGNKVAVTTMEQEIRKLRDILEKSPEKVKKFVEQARKRS